MNVAVLAQAFTQPDLCKTETDIRSNPKEGLKNEENIDVELGSDQTSLHNPWAGGYYPADLTFEESKLMMSENPETFKKHVKSSLVRHVAAINKMTAKGMYFFDYGNAFLLEAAARKRGPGREHRASCQ